MREDSPQSRLAMKERISCLMGQRSSKLWYEGRDFSEHQLNTPTNHGLLFRTKAQYNIYPPIG